MQLKIGSATVPVASSRRPADWCSMQNNSPLSEPSLASNCILVRQLGCFAKRPFQQLCHTSRIIRMSKIKSLLNTLFSSCVIPINIFAAAFKSKPLAGQFGPVQPAARQLEYPPARDA
jgi:hypothetical protein